MDKKTKQILSEGGALSSLVQSDGWKDAKKMLIKKMGQLDILSLIGDIRHMEAEDIKNELSIRFTIRDIILKWISEIEGGVDQTEQYYKIMEETMQDDFVINKDTN